MNQIKKITYLALGGGVQSTALLLYLEEHAPPEFPPPDIAIFADTGWEPAGVYAHIDHLKRYAGTPILVAPARSNLREDIMAGVSHSGHVGFVDIPLYFKDPASGEVGIARRQCTSNYKIVNIEAKLREHLGVQRIDRRVAVTAYLGISTDEFQRAKDNPNPNITNVYPLLGLGMSRADCYRYLTETHPQLRVRKSACIGCPYHSQDVWRALTPAEREDAIEVDEAIRHGQGTRGWEGFLHTSGQPLREVFSLMDRQETLPFPDGDWNAECTGHCGV